MEKNHQYMELTHLPRKTKEAREDLIDQLASVIPSCITEDKVKDGNGGINRVVDLDKLRDLLNKTQFIEGEAERYCFTWPGKRAARAQAVRSINKTLRPETDKSVNWETTQNLYIEGDNLDVLKLLRSGYGERVKMIYIDPPYNTGNDFVYRDDFKKSVREEELAAGSIDNEGNRYVINTEVNGRFHSDWCSMMYSRLMVARPLLSKDGVIFISIDDHEVHNLRKICDEIFGETNFVGMFKWNKTATPPSLSYKIRGKYEYILCYEKELNSIKYNGGTVSGGDMPLLNDGNNICRLSFPKDAITFNFDGDFNPGTYGRVRLINPLRITDGRATSDVVLEGPFKWTQNTVSEEIKAGTSFIIKTKKFAVRYERQGERIKRPADVISKKECGVGTNEDGKKEIRALFDEDVMSYPKPVSLIKYLIPLAETDKDSIVLDFFSGSGTTAQAVMELNAEDGGRRQFICVQLNEGTLAESKARKANHQTIPEIARERIRRAGEKIREMHPEVDTGFRSFRLDNSNYRDGILRSAKEVTQQSLGLTVDNILSDRSEEDLLYGAMLTWGVPISLKVERERERERA